MSRKTIQVSDEVKAEIQKIRQDMGAKNESQVIQAMIYLMDRHFKDFHWYLCKTCFEDANPDMKYELSIGRDIEGNKIKKKSN